MRKYLTRSLAVLAAVSVAAAANAQDLSLEGKTIGVTVVGTDHHWDLMAYQGQIEQLEALGAEVIALDAGRNDQTQISQIQTLIAQRPDAIIEQLGNIDVLDPWLKRIKEAGIPLFTVDTATPHAINNTTSNNYNIGAELALQMVQEWRRRWRASRPWAPGSGSRGSSFACRRRGGLVACAGGYMAGEGKVIVFNGFYSVPVCKIRYDQLMYVLSGFPGIEVVDPELRDVIPNTVQSAYADVTDMLTKHGPDSGLKSVWACWDVPMVGATQAVEAAGRTGVQTYGVDGSPEYVEMVADPDSPAAAVAAQQPYEIGRTAALNVARYLNGMEVPPFTLVPAVLINKANASELADDFLPK